jgi:hypothetical protein
MADGATDLSDLLGGSSPVQNPSLPQSTTFAPIVTGGVDPFIALSPNSSANQNVKTVQQHQTFSYVKYLVRSTLTYVAFFIAAVIISLPIPRQLFLQYIPNMYTSGGVVSYMGASVLGLIAVAITYVLSTFLSVLI